MPLTQSFNQALNICGIPTLDAHGPHHQLLTICAQALNLVESDGEQKALIGKELAYHNRQHIADACLALGFFLRDVKEYSVHEKLILMLTMLVHDFGHQGMSNPPKEVTQEEMTVNLLAGGPLQQLDKKDILLLETLVIGTTPANLSIVNSRYIDDPSNRSYLMQSLINDADIAASFIDELTPKLSELILIEMGQSNPIKSDIDKTILSFKENFKITTPIAKAYLGLN